VALGALFWTGLLGLFWMSTRYGWTDFTGSAWGMLQPVLGWGGWIVLGVLGLRWCSRH
jgi:hypothetical protein